MNRVVVFLLLVFAFSACGIHREFVNAEKKIPGTYNYVHSWNYKAPDGNGNSYTSRAYKKIRVLIAESEKLLAEKEKEGQLSESSVKEANRLILRFSQLKLIGKIRSMHAQAIYNILLALGETESELFIRFRNLLP